MLANGYLDPGPAFLVQAIWTWPTAYGQVRPRLPQRYANRSQASFAKLPQLLGRGAATRGALAACSVVADGLIGRGPTVGRSGTGCYQHIPIVLLAYAPGAVSRC